MNDINRLRAMCAGLNIRPLISKRTSEVSFEACAGVVEGKKIRQTFGAKYWGSVEEAFGQAKKWLTNSKKEIKEDRSAFVSVPHSIRPLIAYMTETCEQQGFKLLEVFDEGIKTLVSRKAIVTKSFTEAASDFLKFKERENVGLIYLKDLKTRYNAFSADFGDWKIADITAADIEDWLEDRELNPVSWNNWRRDLVSLWNHAINSRNGWVTRNVAEEVARKKTEDKEVTAFTVPQAKEILAIANEEFPRLMPFLVMGMFCGLRISEIERANWEDIDWETKSVHAGKHKRKNTAANRHVTILPVALAWLERFRLSGGPICTGQDARRADLNQLRERTFDFAPNIFRHSYGSFHSQAFKKPADTAQEMGHKSTEMIYKHYRKPMPELVALGFWELTPEAVVLG